MNVSNEVVRTVKNMRISWCFNCIDYIVKDYDKEKNEEDRRITKFEICSFKDNCNLNEKLIFNKNSFTLRAMYKNHSKYFYNVQSIFLDLKQSQLYNEKKKKNIYILSILI